LFQKRSNEIVLMVTIIRGTWGGNSSHSTLWPYIQNQNEWN